MRPSAASDKIRNGVRMARNQYSGAVSGTATKAKSNRANIAQRSWLMARICWSAR